MKKLIVFTLLIFSVTFLHARAIQEDYRKAEEKARVSYAFGMVLGSNLTSVDLELDYAAFTEGLKAAFGDDVPQFSEEEALEIIDIALQASMERRAEEYRLTEEIFLAMNRERILVEVTQSGLQYEPLFETEGKKPTINSIVRVLYEGSFIDGVVFDSSEYDEDGVTIPLDMVIEGWAEGIMLMSEGSIYRLFIPSHLAYGKDGIQSIIPPYSTLIFTVELLEIIDPEEEAEE
jgi:FKBP-type peptidyl-prolyl cis-trans isomerase